MNKKLLIMCLLLMPMVASVQSNAMGREITLNVGYTEPTINVSIRPRVPLRIPSLSIDGTTLYFDEAWQGHAYAPEIEAKTDYKMSLLKESGEYTEAETAKMRKEIYGYLMLEKVVYFRDKYDYAKQKNNISRLKKLQPASLKESNNREKQKGMGKLISGKIKW